ncbi:hypothetical protein [Alloactinosynnema sp. L-07]|uniref:imm11 family protein n=1 Tax=Alloactinosynnema sp. L-07 TaxID=1653480 RepID=UPI00065EF07F|nr:DUF1629 domain-containing protein [Alloactinosynnema sp. L-07]CRK57549.1 hypothetical protein [Alloactinosynnema sp. L-07]
MRLYEPQVRPGFEWVLPVHDTDNEYLWSLDGTPRQAAWRPVPVARLAVEDTGEPRAEADLPWLGGHVLVLRPRAVAALRPLLEACGELLPLACPDADLWLFNALTVTDALDESASEIVRFDDGEILAVERYAFHPERISAPVFKVPQLLRGPLFVTDDFIDLVAAAELTGFGFSQVWAGSPAIVTPLED